MQGGLDDLEKEEEANRRVWNEKRRESMDTTLTTQEGLGGPRGGNGLSANLDQKQQKDERDEKTVTQNRKTA